MPRALRTLRFLSTCGVAAATAVGVAAATGEVSAAAAGLWALVLVPVAIVALSELPGLRAYRRSLRNRCPGCGYDLTGNVTGVCPECGERR